MTSDSDTRHSADKIPSLDGIRALAVSLVFFAHSGLENVVPGGLGVTIFFVLSGFLITTLMRREHGTHGSIDFKAFYLRRCLRLMPPLLIVVGLTVALSYLAVVSGSYSLQGLLSVLFYFGNYFVVAHDFHHIPAGVGVVWSLAVEEHYYLFYPPLAAFLLRRHSATTGAVVLLLLCGAVLIRRAWLATHGGSPDYIGMATDTRIDAILVGCLMGLWRNPVLDANVPLDGLRSRLLAVACLTTLAGSLLYRSEIFRLVWRYTLQSMAVAPLIYLAIAHSTRAPYRWLNSRPLMYLGGVSYTIYLSHQVILFMINRHWPQLGWASTTMATAVLTLVFAELMRSRVEAPLAALRRRLQRQSAAQAATTVTAKAHFADSKQRGPLVPVSVASDSSCH